MTNTTGKGQFKKGDPRINRSGRPKTFNAFRELALQLAHETAQTKDGTDLVLSGHRVTVAEDVLRQWAMSKNPILQKAFIEIAFGKVPDNLQIDGAVILKVVYDEPDNSPAAST